MGHLLDFPIIIYRQCTACKRRYKKLTILMLRGGGGFCSDECYIYYYEEVSDLVDQLD